MLGVGIGGEVIGEQDLFDDLIVGGAKVDSAGRNTCEAGEDEAKARVETRHQGVGYTRC